MSQNLNILIVEDSETDYELILRELEHSGYRIRGTRIETRDELIKNLNKGIWDVVISDNKLPGFSGSEALRITRKMDKNTPFIIVSATIGEEVAVNAMRSGANDYILKDNLKRLAPAIEREVREAKVRLKQKQNEKQIVLTKLRYQFLAESIRDVFFALDFDLNFTYWNEAARKEFGKNKVMGKHLHGVFPEWQHSNITKQIEKSIRNKTAQTISFEYQANRMESFKGNIYPSTEGVSILLSKVTEEKKNKDKLININRELETLLYRISHDLRGPVASVIGLLNVARKDESFNKEVFIDMMHSGMHRLNDTLGELLNISNIKLGEPNVQEFNVSKLIHNILNSYAFTSGFNELSYEITIDEDLTLTSDLSLVQSIWQNLIENAIRYRRKRHPNRIIIIARQEKNRIDFHISDTGQGIPKDLQTRVFDMFFRGSEESNGSGLGLYIVKSAINKINGTIAIDKNYSSGTRFSLSLPQLKKNVRLVKNQ